MLGRSQYLGASVAIFGTELLPKGILAKIPGAQCHCARAQDAVVVLKWSGERRLHIR